MPRKTGQEARVERTTWFAMSMPFVLLSFDEGLTLPSYVIPIIISIILLISGVYQYTQGWRISPIVWIISALLMAVSIYEIVASITFPIDLVLVSLVAVIIIIVWGIVTNES